MVSVNGNVDVVLALSFDGILGSVLTVTVVVEVNIDFLLVRSRNFNLYRGSSYGHVLVTFVTGLNDEGIGFDAGISGEGSRGNINVEGRSLDWGSVEGDGDIVNSSVFWLVGDVVGSVSVVNNIGLDWSVRSLNVNIEFVTSFLAAVSVFVTCFDGESSRVSIEVSRFETRSVSDTVGGICSRIDLNINR